MRSIPASYQNMESEVQSLKEKIGNGTNDQAKTFEDKLEEIRDETFRRNNLVIYGVPECQSKVGAERKENDHKFINILFGETLRVDPNGLNIDKIIRMGAINEQATRPRPLLIGFDSESDKYKVLKRTCRLKGTRGIQRSDSRTRHDKGPEKDIKRII